MDILLVIVLVVAAWVIFDSFWAALGVTLVLAVVVWWLRKSRGF